MTMEGRTFSIGALVSRSASCMNTVHVLHAILHTSGCVRTTMQCLKIDPLVACTAKCQIP